MVGSDLFDCNGNWVSDDEIFESIMNFMDLPIENLEGGILDGGLAQNTLTTQPGEPAHGDGNFQLKQPLNVSEQTPRASTILVQNDFPLGSQLKASPNVDSDALAPPSSVSLDALISDGSKAPKVGTDASRSSTSPASFTNGVHYGGGAFQAPSPVSVLESSEKITPTSSSSGNDGSTRSKRIRNPTYKPWFEMSEEPIKRKSKKRKNLSQLSGVRDGASGSKAASGAVTVKENPWLQPPPLPPTGNKKCLHCEITKTPQWREGPMGPKTLCNACGVRYKSGRLLPEYRPAASPTFVPSLHSNSHKKVIQMRSGGGAGGGGVSTATAEKEFAYVDSFPEFVPMDSFLFD